MWLGHHSGGQTFQVPFDFEQNNTYISNGVKYAKFGNICWFTNLDTDKRHEEMQFYKKYTPEDYPQYDNFDAIEVSRVTDIPCDYDGLMGVPITFLDKYNPNQFEILGLDRYTVPKEFLVGGRVAINGKPRYARIIIRRKTNAD